MGDCPLTHSGDSRLYLESSLQQQFFFFFIHFYFWLSWVFIALRELSLVAVPWVLCIAVASLLLWSISSRAHRLQ